MAKLTMKIREDILNNLVVKAFKERLAALATEEVTLGLEVWEASFTPDHLKLIKSCPASWFQTVKRVQGRFDYQHLEFNLKDTVPIPHGKTYGTLVALEHKDELCKRVLNWNTRKEALDKELRRAKELAKATLDSVTTTDKLMEVWPEVAPYVPEVAKVGLPMIPVKDLNKAFNLAR